MKKCLLFFLMPCCVCLYASDYVRMPDMRSMAIGGNMTTQSSLFNPSLLALQTNKTIHFQYFNRYQLKELGTITGYFLYPNPVLPVGFSFSSFGYEAYRQTLFRFSAGKQLSECWHLGVAFQYTMLQTELFEETPAMFSADIGCLYQPFDNLLIGLFIMNWPAVRMKDKTTDTKFFIDYFMQIGVEWEVINNLLIMVSGGMWKEASFEWNAGLEYTVFDSFHLRCGVMGEPLYPTFGIGYDFSSFSLDLAAVSHPVLGISTGVGLSFHF
ncbi:hypothetical protein LJB97_02945 [Parabacteroides sp. OttesenSCG-928-O15]|nr:hypothetical protein [Parabacteroides sp. OttesenSCG-928-O15]